MKHIFLDSSVLLSFCKSTTGGSALVLRWCREGKIKGHISQKVIAEVRKNTSLKMGPKEVQRFEYILGESFLVVESNPPQSEIDACKQIIRDKDAIILATARTNQNIGYLLTLDIKDFKKPSVLQFASPLEILTPGEFIQKHKITL